MGYTLPSPDSPAERARALMARKDALEAELEAQGSILKANNTDMRQPLVDHDGFPRADLDVWAVRHARVRVIELRNDLTTLMDEMAKTLETIYPRSRPEPPQAEDDELLPFARVNGVAPGSPAADAGMERGDLVVKFGELRHPQSNLQAVATLVADNENKAISVLVRRLGVERVTALRLIPRQGWGGRGSLGWSIFPLNCL
ncbi:hypothetical protein B0F90DRAFT_1625627 [Multifurca ochricompacta]|uniref:Probable 26S proteasome regulatory subunit p27 n=1 Tax=Multifurca ochricompacta TaxID=376703 RepID=A0AAD4M7W3_9AGAM|nr:hypothetical protein B0F90DRAFT_1625627 [Multifurca ochricompacta]